MQKKQLQDVLEKFKLEIAVEKELAIQDMEKKRREDASGKRKKKKKRRLQLLEMSGQECKEELLECEECEEGLVECEEELVEPQDDWDEEDWDEQYLRYCVL